MSFIEDYITKVQRPGNGFGSGCTVVARKTGQTEGVEWTRITVTDNFTGERERIYLTESGHRVEQAVGSYGDGINWAVYGPGITGAFVSGGGIAYTSNLSRAFQMISQKDEIR